MPRLQEMSPKLTYKILGNMRKKNILRRFLDVRVDQFYSLVSLEDEPIFDSRFQTGFSKYE